MPTFLSDHGKLNYHYRITGPDKPTIALIHDLSMNQNMWQQFAAGISKDYNILTYDLYGHGSSSDSEAILSINLLLDELTALLHHLGLRTVHLAGCRYGAIIALEFYLRTPQSAASLTLLSMPFYVQKKSYSREAAKSIQLLKLDQQLFEKRYLMHSIHPVTISKARLVIRALRSLGTNHFAAATRELEERINAPEFDLISKLKELRVPTLFMHGEYDPVYPSALAMIFSGFAPDSHFELIPDASALIPVDRPDAVLAAFGRFMNSRKQIGPLVPDGIRMINELNRLTERALKSQEVHHHNLHMYVMNGETHVFWNGTELKGKWNRRNAQGLLLFIIMNHGAVKRDMIVDAFTPDVPLNLARNHLRVQLSYLNNLFRAQDDPALNELLIISRDSVALNTRGESDIGTFIRLIDDLQWSEKTAEERSNVFLACLQDYNPEVLKSFSGEWVRQLETSLRNKFSRAMAQIMLDLRKENNEAGIRRMLKKGKIVEPYEGFCKSWMEALKVVR